MWLHADSHVRNNGQMTSTQHAWTFSLRRRRQTVVRLRIAKKVLELDSETVDGPPGAIGSQTVDPRSALAHVPTPCPAAAGWTVQETPPRLKTLCAHQHLPQQRAHRPFLQQLHQHSRQRNSRNPRNRKVGLRVTRLLPRVHRSGTDVRIRSARLSTLLVGRRRPSTLHSLRALP